MTESVTPVSRRSFLRTGAIGGGVAAASGLAAPAVLAQSPHGGQDAVVLVELGHLPRDGAAVRRPGERDVRRPAAGRPAAGGRGGRRLPDPGRGGGRRARRRPPRHRLLVRQDQGGVAVRHRAGVRRRRGAGARLDPVRRRQGPLPRAGAGPARAADRRLLRAADADAAARLVREPAGGGRGHAGAEVPHGRPVGGREPGARARGDAASGRRDRPGDGARRHRRLRVQQPDLGPPLRRAGRGEELHARLLPPGLRVLRDHLQPAVLRIARSRPAGDPRVRRRGGEHRQLRPRPWRTTPRTCRR